MSHELNESHTHVTPGPYRVNHPALYRSTSDVSFQYHELNESHTHVTPGPYRVNHPALYRSTFLPEDLNMSTPSHGDKCPSSNLAATWLQCVAVCCSVLQCVAVCCSVLQCVAVEQVLVFEPCGNMVALCCVAV